MLAGAKRTGSLVGQATNQPFNEQATHSVSLPLCICLYVCWAELCPLRLLRKLNAFIWPPPQHELLLHLLPLSYNCESLLRVFKKKNKKKSQLHETKVRRKKSFYYFALLKQQSACQFPAKA